MDPTARDEAVRRLRAESARRIDQQDRRRMVSSWCALATIAAGMSMLALDARAVSSRAEEAARQVAAEARVRREERSRQDERVRREERVRQDVRQDVRQERKAAVERYERQQAELRQHCDFRGMHGAGRRGS